MIITLRKSTDICMEKYESIYKLILRLEEYKSYDKKILYLIFQKKPREVKKYVLLNGGFLSKIISKIGHVYYSEERLETDLKKHYSRLESTKLGLEVVKSIDRFGKSL
jgi:hypothetical protein